jgi:hypothetical protein
MRLFRGHVAGIGYEEHIPGGGYSNLHVRAVGFERFPAESVGLCCLVKNVVQTPVVERLNGCLLYTSDAADEL